MAYSQVPDKSEVYKRENVDFYLVVNHYNDIPDLVNWHFEDKEGVGESGSDTIDFINNMIQVENWKLFKQLEKEFFKP
jgi:hypothetical protein